MSAAALDRDGERGNSQTLKAQLALRDLLLGGALAPGERIAELPLVDRLGVSRTPLRSALMRLEQEGLVEAIPSGGYRVKTFTEREVFEAIEIRGTLEGLAARFAAERGVEPEALQSLRTCLSALDGIVGRQPISLDAFSRYVDLNARFHAELMALSASRTLLRQIESAVALPFASPSAFVRAQALLPEALTILLVAQDQHRCVVEAIERREGARAEALMREHARLAHRNLTLALKSERVMGLVPGHVLIAAAS